MASQRMTMRMAAMGSMLLLGLVFLAATTAAAEDCPTVFSWECSEPAAEVRCEELPEVKCVIHCRRPVCEVECFGDRVCDDLDPVNCVEPTCESVCAPPVCEVVCQPPEPDCTAVYEDPVCAWVEGPDPYCEADGDGDGVADGFDNCPTVANPDQWDWDGDETGDDCDRDADGDGVPVADDLCPFTELEVLVDPDSGCSLDQLCPCDGPPDLELPWKNHGKYVRCVAKASKVLQRHGLITKRERKDLVSTAAQSDCGK